MSHIHNITRIHNVIVIIISTNRLHISYYELMTADNKTGMYLGTHEYMP